MATVTTTAADADADVLPVRIPSVSVRNLRRVQVVAAGGGVVVAV